MESGDFAAWNATRWSEVVPEIAPESALLAVRFMRVAELLDRSQQETLRPWLQFGVTSVDDFRTLAMIRLADPDGVRPTDIAEAFRATKGTISNRISRLEREGWISRLDARDDKRSHVLIIPIGRQGLIDDMYRALVDNHQAFFADIRKPEEAAMIKGLARLLPRHDFSNDLN